MKNSPELTPGHPRRLAWATAGAAAIALLVLLTMILPVEYGVDPLRTGRLLGLDSLRPDDTSSRRLDPDDDADLLQQVTARYAEQRIVVLQQSTFQESNEPSSRIDFRVDLANVTEVQAKLEWRDDDRIAGQPTLPDRFGLRLQGPGGRQSQYLEARNAPDGQGILDVGLPWTSAPRPTINGTQWTFDAQEDHSAIGHWYAALHFHPGHSTNASTTGDPGEEWTLTVTVLVYSLQTAAQSDLDAWDRAEFLLSPGGRLEYKFAADANAPLEYSWNASASLFYDMHGDRGVNDEDPHSYRQGRSAEDAGRIAMAFTGRHGWYWQSFENDRDVRLTLLTRGDYRIIGVV